jgi:hypothetical protein
MDGSTDISTLYREFTDASTEVSRSTTLIRPHAK